MTNEIEKPNLPRELIYDKMPANWIMVRRWQDFINALYIRVGEGEALTNTELAELLGNVSDADNDTQILVNNSGVIGSSANFTYDDSTNTLTITGLTDQSASLLEIKNSFGVPLITVRHTGHLDCIDGINTIASQYGSSLLTFNYNEGTPEHTNGVGSYDYTGGVRELLFTKTSGDDFTQSDEDNGNWVVLFGDNTGAIAEIKEFVDADNVVVDGPGWDQDLSSQSFYIFKHPTFVVGDGNKIEFSVGSSGEFEIYSYNFTGSKMAEIELKPAADNIVALEIKAEAKGYNLIVGQNIHYITGDLQPGDTGGGLFITMDDTEATSSDATTIIGALAVSTTDVNNATKRAFVVLPGFDDALTVLGSSAIDPDYGYEVTSGAVVDRVNSGGAGDDAFINNAVDVELFDSDNDYILVGSDNTFEIFQAILAINSSKNIDKTIEYSTGAGTWSALVLTGDSLNGWQGSGLYIWPAPGDWAKVSQAEAPADITNAYYIKISRTVGGAIPTLPTESFFKIFADQETGMTIRGDGTIEPVIMADASASNSSIYYSSDQSKLVFKDSGGGVNDLY